MKAEELRRRIEEAAPRGAPVTLAHPEAAALLEVVAAATAMFEPTVDKNVARRRMERLLTALARLDGA